MWNIRRSKYDTISKNIDITKQFMMGQFRGPDSHTLKHLKNVNSYIVP